MDRLLGAVAICAVGCLLPASAWAEEAAKSAGEPAAEAQASSDTHEKPTESAVGGEEAGKSSQGLFVDLGEMIVTATRNRKMLKDAPGSVTVVTRDQIQSMASQIGDVGQSLDAQTGVRVQRFGGMGHGTSIRLRGTLRSQTLVLVDGRPVNAPSLSRADISWLAADEIERIEIVRGPMSPLYGGHAVGGTVNIITRRPPEEMTTKVGMSYGTDATRIHSLMHGATVGKFGYLVHGTWRKTNGYRANDDDRDRSMRMALTYDFELVRAGVDLAVGDRRLELPGPQPSHNRRFWSAADWRHSNHQATTLFDHDEENRLSYSAYLEGEQWSVKGWRNEWNQRNWQQSRVFPFTYYPDAVPGVTLGNPGVGDRFIHNRYKTDSWGVDAQYTSDPILKNQFTVGGGYKLEDFDVLQKTYNDPDYPEEIFAAWPPWPATVVDTGLNPVQTTAKWAVNRQTWSVFAQDEIDLDPVTLTIGARRDMPNDHHHRWTWRANAVWDVTEKTRLRGGYGQAYRPPSLNDEYWPEDDWARGNDGLQPELSWSWEAGVEQEFGDRWVTRLTFWNQKIKNMIEWAPTGPLNDAGSPKWQPDNVDTTVFRGLEFENRVKITDTVTAYGGATYFLKRETFDERVRDYNTNDTEFIHRTATNTPLYTVDLGLDWQDLVWEGLRVNLDGHFVGNRERNYSVFGTWPDTRQFYQKKHLRGYFTMNGKISQTFDLGFSEFEVFFAVSNIFDKGYATQFGGELRDRDYPAPHRQFLLGASMKF